MTKSIPASQLVSSTPSVLAAGGNPLSPNGVMVDNSGDTSIPIGVAQGFPDLDAIEAWYGADSIQYTLASKYFGGFSGSNQLPSMLWVYQQNLAAVSGYLRGGSLPALSLLRGYSGVLDITVDGRPVATGNINLATAASYTAAAGIIQTALQANGTIFTGTATTVLNSNQLNVTAIASGTLVVGDVVTGTGIPAGTTIIAIPVGDGTGEYTMSQNATAANVGEAVYVSTEATCTYDALRNAFVITSASTGVNSSVSYGTGAFAIDLLLTAATGAVLSAGSAAQSPATAMNGVVASTQNWISFSTVEDPDGGTGAYANKLLFSEWTSTQSPAGNERFLYVGWDPSAAPGATYQLEACFGSAVESAGYNGTMCVTDYQDGAVAFFVMGMWACLDTTEENGAVDAAYRVSNAGLNADVDDGTVAQNLLSNNYSFYGIYGTANQTDAWLFNGQMPGQWAWSDDYVNQILLNAAIQLALLTGRKAAKRLPYVTQGYARINSWLRDPIKEFIDFGAIVPGVALSDSQITAINTAAGNTGAAQSAMQIGYYLQITAASAQTRQTRGSPPISLWYADGGSIQKLNVASVDVQ